MVLLIDCMILEYLAPKNLSDGLSLLGKWKGRARVIGGRI